MANCFCSNNADEFLTSAIPPQRDGVIGHIIGERRRRRQVVDQNGEHIEHTFHYTCL